MVKNTPQMYHVLCILKKYTVIYPSENSVVYLKKYDKIWYETNFTIEKSLK